MNTLPLTIKRWPKNGSPEKHMMQNRASQEVLEGAEAHAQLSPRGKIELILLPIKLLCMEVW